MQHTLYTCVYMRERESWLRGNAVIRTEGVWDAADFLAVFAI